MTARMLTDPQITAENETWFAAAANGELLVKQCDRCDRAFHYPRDHCPLCHCAQTRWTQASGRGSIYSFTVLRRAPVPYCVASVELAEGPRLWTNIVDCDFDDLRCGMQVEVAFLKTQGGISIPVFTPIPGEKM